MRKGGGMASTENRLDLNGKVFEFICILKMHFSDYKKL